MDNNNLNVMDMANSYAAMADDSDVSDLFTEDKPEPKRVSEPVKEKKPWTPDPSLLEGMDEMSSSGPVYDKKEIIDKMKENEEGLKNIMDDTTLKDADNIKSDMNSALGNINAAKIRHNIDKLQIPTDTLLGGEYEAKIMSCANDPDPERSSSGLDEIFDEIEKLHPDFILSRIIDGDEEPKKNIVKINQNVDESDDLENETIEEDSEETATTEDTSDLKIIINKRDVSNVSFNEEEIEKIRKSRTVELNIVETKNLEFSSIKNVPKGNAIDNILSPYIRKHNDIVAALPASKYRATFTGLSYVEMIDLSNSQELNTLDGERKKWSIAFNHIKNQSIGPWRSYNYYIDDSGNKVELKDGDALPENISDDDIIEVTKFEDFLMKTSYIDLDYIIWKILCATTKEKELISINCNKIIDDKGTRCGNTYDWIYNPIELLDTSSISPEILEEIKVTTEANTTDEIMKNYESSLVNDNNIVKLSSSGIYVMYGHISAYEYLNSVYGRIIELQKASESGSDDPTLVSNLFKITALPSIKGFLIPDGDAYLKITGADNITKVIDQLDEVDCSIIDKISNMTTEPYQFVFSIRDIICPKCGDKSTIRIENLTTLLFIVARSLANVEVQLKKL